LLQLTWRKQTGFLYDLDTLDLVGSFSFQTTRNEGWGVASNGSIIVVSDGSEYLHLWDITTFSEVKRIRITDQISGAPVRLLNELEFVGDELLANVWFKDQVARINVNAGVVVGWYDLRGLPYKKRDREEVLNGLAYCSNDNTLYVTGKKWSKIFKFQLPQ